MSINLASIQSLRRVFRQNFSAHDITKPLVSCEKDADAAQTRRFMTDRGYEVIGVRHEGLVIGFLKRNSLQNGPCSAYVWSFDDVQVSVDTAPLSDVVLGLRESPRLFVSVFGRVGGIVTRGDLQKPPVRMWLFGMVTLIAMRVTRTIKKAASIEDWRQYLPDARLEKAK